MSSAHKACLLFYYIFALALAVCLHQLFNQEVAMIFSMPAGIFGAFLFAWSTA